MIFVLREIVPVFFLILIIFGLSFALTYVVFEKNLIILLSIFDLFILLMVAYNIIDGIYIALFILIAGVILYIEFGRDIIANRQQ